MARPVVHDDAVRSRLLEVTLELVDREGPARVTLREVAASAGTSTTAIYSLFGGKTELLQAVVDGGFASFAQSQREAADGGLRTLGLAYREWALGHPALYRLMFGSSARPDGGVAPSSAVGEAAMAPLRDAVATGQRSGELRAASVEAAVIAIWGQVHGLVSLEFACVEPEADWAGIYAEALEAVARAWAA
ncbi:TetR/AcrR family transcriptional regulator [Sinomonas sp. ASV322]|uniref:TetR/AcrR family transcriptional regulator n=1 Tax=Sinomonas sp. ASV322 TaxID=3041920 RepID=UPI0027DBF796|nr:TetR/AcrR family transcriptional regulator [Sinomonas sp. ASV322]MDQ4502948.1 TetR/AcrR family transcriptional regulator [Sinomonas sp. ASV322]